MDVKRCTANIVAKNIALYGIVVVMDENWNGTNGRNDSPTKARVFAAGYIYIYYVDRWLDIIHDNKISKM